jgi:hypothetical protein
MFATRFVTITIVQVDPSPAEISSHAIASGVIHPGAAPFLGNGDAAQPHRGERVELCPRKVLLAIPLGGVRREPRTRELAHAFAQQLVRFAKRHRQSDFM